MDHPEVLENQCYVLWFSRRDTENRIYKDAREVVFKGNRLHALQLKAMEVFEIEGVGPAEIQIAKHFPQNFEWTYINPNEEII